ncbi:hypothetical protein CCP3SC1AL1_2030001 [Gammaproteobacteria bacterium]
MRRVHAAAGGKERGGGKEGGVQMHPKILTVILFAVTVPRCCPAITPAEVERLITALIQVESGGRQLAVGDHGQAVGVLQLHPIMVQDVNRIAGTRYTLADRYNPEKSKAMARLYFRHYGRTWTVEQACRHWNSGPGSTSGTDIYWQRVKARLKQDGKGSWQ